MLSRFSTVLALALCIIQAAQALPAPVYLAPDIQRTTNNLTPDSSAVLPRDKVFANNDVAADSKSARSVFKNEDLPADRVLSGRDKVFANNDLTADTKAARVKA